MDCGTLCRAGSYILAVVFATVFQYGFYGQEITQPQTLVNFLYDAKTDVCGIFKSDMVFVHTYVLWTTCLMELREIIVK